MPADSSPRLSVVIAAYNHAPFVRECIDSVRAQEVTDWEIVVTDDGSRDETADILRALAAEDSRIRLKVFTSNQGACLAMNDAISRARGEFIAVLNSDDRWLPGKLSEQLRYLDTHPQHGAVFALPRLIDERGQPFTDPDHKDQTIFNVDNRPRHAWLRHFFHYNNCLCHASLLIRRRCYQCVGLYDPRLAQLPDLDMWVRLCAQFEIHILQQPLVEVRILDSERNASAARPPVLARDAWERLQVLRRYPRLDEQTLNAVFADDAAALGLSAELPPLLRLAQIALSIQTSAHRLLALDLLFAALEPSAGTDLLADTNPPAAQGPAGPADPVLRPSPSQLHRLVADYSPLPWP